MKLGRFIKQPREKYTIAVDFSRAMDDDESIDSDNSSVTAADANGANVTSQIIHSVACETNLIRATVKNGSDGDRFRLSFLAHTDTGNIYEKDVLMTIKEV